MFNRVLTTPLELKRFRYTETYHDQNPRFMDFLNLLVVLATPEMESSFQLSCKLVVCKFTYKKTRLQALPVKQGITPSTVKCDSKCKG